MLRNKHFNVIHYLFIHSCGPMSVVSLRVPPTVLSDYTSGVLASASTMQAAALVRRRQPGAVRQRREQQTLLKTQ